MKSITQRVIFILILIVMQIAPAIHSVTYADVNVEKKSVSDTQQIGIKNPASDLWRAVRQRQFDGRGDINISSQIKGANSGLLINTEGNNWRQLRRQKLIPYTAYFILGVVALLTLMFLLIRRVKIPNGRSEKKISRLSTMQRISHWFLVILAGFMAITGLLLLFGRFGIIPLIGAEAFSPLASASKEGHNLFGPIMIASLLLMLIYYIRHNLPGKGDLKWLLTAGGLFSRKHLKTGFFNAGEKALFWGIISLGVVLSITGLVLLFPYYKATINMSQLALVVHAIAAILLIALSLGHIFMAIKIEGTIDAITSGDVDENWAKAHHSRWYEEVSGKSASQAESTTDLKDDLSESGGDGVKGAMG